MLAYDRSRGAHHVLYEDGEDEWLKLPAEVVSWQKGVPARPLGAGLSFGASTLSSGASALKRTAAMRHCVCVEALGPKSDVIGPSVGAVLPGHDM